MKPVALGKAVKTRNGGFRGATNEDI